MDVPRAMSDDELEAEARAQGELHGAIEDALTFDGALEPGAVLTRWVVLYELTRLDDKPSSAGHLYGPREMTTWQALGLVEWARRFGLHPDDEDEDEDE